MSKRVKVLRSARIPGDPGRLIVEECDGLTRIAFAIERGEKTLCDGYELNRIWLTKEQWLDLCDLRYELRVEDTTDIKGEEDL